MGRLQDAGFPKLDLLRLAPCCRNGPARGSPGESRARLRKSPGCFRRPVVSSQKFLCGKLRLPQRCCGARKATPPKETELTKENLPTMEKGGFAAHESMKEKGGFIEIRPRGRGRGFLRHIGIAFPFSAPLMHRQGPACGACCPSTRKPQIQVGPFSRMSFAKIAHSSSDCILLRVRSDMDQPGGGRNSARGLMSVPISACSSACASQPAMRASAKSRSGVSAGRA